MSSYLEQFLVHKKNQINVCIMKCDISGHKVATEIPGV